MRRMRFAWYHLLFILPALALAFGIQHYLRKNRPAAPSAELAVVKPSFYKQDSVVASSKATSLAKAAASKTNRTVAKAPAPVSADEATLAVAPPPALKKEGGFFSKLARLMSGRKSEPLLAQKTEARKPAAAESKALAEGGEAKGEVERAAAERAQRARRLAAPKDFDLARMAPSACSSIEYRGDGPKSVVSAEAWANFMTEFRGLKKEMADWLHVHGRKLPEATRVAMEKRMASLRVYRPPVEDEPDLSWRGIAVWAQDQADGPVLRMSPGFLKMMEKQPLRAKFELARLVAQTWSPCELEKLEAGQAWDPLLACLQVKDTAGCGVGSYSEAGWAVSTALAAVVAPPDCTPPAFQKAEIAKCLVKMPFGGATRATASVESSKGGAQ